MCNVECFFKWQQRLNADSTGPPITLRKFKNIFNKESIKNVGPESIFLYWQKMVPNLGNPGEL
jgi:hypothetical protein